MIFPIPVVDCDCPPKFSNETAPGSYHSWNETEFDSCSDEEYTVGTEITYGCPIGHVFETEELLITQNMSLAFSTMTQTCAKFSVWTPLITPKCIRKCLRKLDVDVRNHVGEIYLF